MCVCVCVCDSYAEEARKGLPLGRLGHVRLNTFCDGYANNAKQSLLVIINNQ